MGDIENPENGPAEALVPESKAAKVSSKLDRMRSPSAAQCGTKCLSGYHYLFVTCFVVKMMALNQHPHLSKGELVVELA
jgi:hypothetical protein